MRLVGKLENALQAGRFSDFLLTKTIDSKVEPDGDLFAIWVRDEQMIEQARELFKAFQTAPESSLYTDATNTAQAIRKKESQRKREIEKKTGYAAMNLQIAGEISSKIHCEFSV